MADVDEMSNVAFMAEMNKFFGTRRTASMIGWLLMFAALMRDGETVAQLTERVKGAGYGRVVVINALADAQRFAQHIKALPATDTDKLASVRALIGRMRDAGLTL